MNSSIKMERKQRINDIFVEIKSKVDDGGGSILLFYCPPVNHWSWRCDKFSWEKVVDFCVKMWFLLI